MNTDVTVLAQQYELKVYEGFMDFNRGNGGKLIQEIFIPKYQVIVNSGGAIFHADQPRNISQVSICRIEQRTLTDIQLPLGLAERIATVKEAQLSAENMKKELEPDLAKLWG